MRRIRAAIIGMGFIGRLQYEALCRLPGVEVRALCAHSAGQLPALRESFPADRYTADWREVLADPAVEVVHNCTPNKMHDAVNLAVIGAGKHLYAEKPLSLTAAGARRVCDAAAAAGVLCAVNHPYRMNAAVLEMRDRLRRGQAGRPLYVSGRYYQDSACRAGDYTPRRMPETSPARAVLDIGVHWADTASFVLGQPIRRVYARMYIHHPVRTDPATGREIAIHSDDTTAVMVEFADGTPGSAVFSKCMAGHKNDLVVTVSGEQRELCWRQEQCDRLWIGSQQEGNTLLLMDKASICPEAAAFLGLPAGHAPGWQDAQKNAMGAFYADILQGKRPGEPALYATLADGLQGNRFVEACLVSAREDRWVDL